ncbi:hypothetical protein HanIR_Chr11g0543851 [Helianthus annuus]|nr:hypothetical protein HanIR_Chr11g0543851 [Helianthus annuus]
MPKCQHKRQSCRSFNRPPRGRAQRTRGRDTLLHTGSCPADTRAWSTNADKLQLMKKEKEDGHGVVPNGHGAMPNGHGAVPNGHGAVPELLFRL